MKPLHDDLKKWYFDLFFYPEYAPEYLKGAEKVFTIVRFPDPEKTGERHQFGFINRKFASPYSDDRQFAEFGHWVCTMAEELETVFEQADYLFLLETNFEGPFDVIAIRKLLRKYLPEIESECETRLLRLELEYALQLPFLAMICAINDLWGFRKYPLLELGIASYHDGDVSNFLDIYSPNSYNLTPQVDENVYEEYFPGFRKSVEQLVKWLGDGTMIVHKELDRLGEPRYSFEDRRTEEKPVFDNP